MHKQAANAGLLDYNGNFKTSRVADAVHQARFRSQIECLIKLVCCLRRQTGQIVDSGLFVINKNKHKHVGTFEYFTRPIPINSPPVRDQ